MRQTAEREATVSELKNLYCSEITERFSLHTASFSERAPELSAREEQGLQEKSLCAPLIYSFYIIY